MSKSLRDQMVGKGIVRADETPDAKRAAAQKAREVPTEEKGTPPPFEAPARGVIVGKGAKSVAPRACVTCGVEVPPNRRMDPSGRCLECANEG